MREKTYSFTIEEIPIIVTKKRMKNMYLRISKEDGSVRISAPHQMSDERIYRFAKERIDWIRVYREKYLRAKEGRREVRQLSEAELKQQKLLLKKDVEKLIAKWEPVMGVKASGVTIHININLALAKKPPECLEYVVVHELTHILEPSHNAVFWGYMTQFYPNWKRVRKYLNDEVPE